MTEENIQNVKKTGSEVDENGNRGEEKSRCVARCSNETLQNGEYSNEQSVV